MAEYVELGVWKKEESVIGDEPVNYGEAAFVEIEKPGKPGKDLIEVKVVEIGENEIAEKEKKPFNPFKAMLQVEQILGFPGPLTTLKRINELFRQKRLAREIKNFETP